MFKALISAIFATTLLASASPSFASHKDVFEVSEYSLGYSAEQEKPAPGEKGGTEDINIGVGELQECTTAEAEPASAVAAPARAKKDESQ